MDFAIWEKYYLEIIANFGFDSSKDAEAAELLARLVKGKDIKDEALLKERLGGKNVYVFGGGPSVTKEIEQFDIDQDAVLISADAATSALVEAKMTPDLIVTDLDGKVEEQAALNKDGAIVLIHAHGDNMPTLERWVKEFVGPIVPTCQTVPSPPLSNFGGFTDGDRAIFLADHFDAKSIILVGFDFSGEGSAYKEMEEKKVRKLVWAQLLIGMLDNPRIQFIDEGRPILHF